MSKPPRKKRISNLQSSAEVLHSLLQNGNKNPLGMQFKRWKLWQNWEQVVGPTVAKFSLPVSIDGRSLVVWVQHPVQLQELIFVKKPLMEKINKYMGHRWIANIHFTLDRKHVDAPDAESKINKNLDKLSR